MLSRRHTSRRRTSAEAPGTLEEATLVVATSLLQLHNANREGASFDFEK